MGQVKQMMTTGPAILLILLGQLTTTSYRSVPSQTDSTPFHTSTGEHVHKHGVAVSEDLLCPKAFGPKKVHKKASCKYSAKLHYGDWLYVDGYGLRVVNDVMNSRHRNRIDLWVPTYEMEKSVGTKKLAVYVLRFH